MPGRATSVRLFTALALPAGVSEELAAWARGWLSREGVRLVSAQNLHLTLSFLGERPRDEIGVLREVVQEFAAAAPLLAVGAPILLPRRAPRTAGVEIKDSDGRLADIQRDLAAAVAGAGSWDLPRRGFHPHITLARMRPGTHLPQPPPTPNLEFEPAALELLRSFLQPSGARYETLAATGFADF